MPEKPIIPDHVTKLFIIAASQDSPLVRMIKEQGLKVKPELEWFEDELISDKDMDAIGRAFNWRNN